MIFLLPLAVKNQGLKADIAIIIIIIIIIIITNT